MAYDIFISYRREDSQGLISGTNIARTIKQQLEIEGYKGRVFFDYSELSDSDFERVILSAIEQCKVFVLVLSKDSMMRCTNPNDWVRREIMHAVKCGLKIIPIEPDNLFNGYPEHFPYELNIVRSEQHSKIHMDSSFERDVRAMIKQRIEPTLSKRNYKGAFRWTLAALIAVVLIGGATMLYPTLQEKITQHREERLAEQERITEENVDIWTSLGDEAFQEDNFAEAVKWYRKAAEKGHAPAQFKLGDLYYYFYRGVTHDDAEAVKWFRKVAEQGYADAQDKLGACYYYGIGVTQDYAEAVKWYRKAAEQGNATAQFCLGVCYYNGHGVTKDMNKVIEWFKKAAAQGNESAKNNLKLLGVEY